MLASIEDLYFACLERFESHYQFYRLKSRLFNFCESFIPDFENLHYLLHLNVSENDVSKKMLDNRLQGSFVSRNVVHLSRRNLRDSEISLLSKGYNFVPPTYNTIDKAMVTTEFEALGRILRLKWHFRNEENEFDLDQFKPKPTFNPLNKDAVIEVYMSSLEKRLMKTEIPKDKYNNLLVKSDKL